MPINPQGDGNDDLETARRVVLLLELIRGCSESGRVMEIDPTVNW